MGLFVGKTYLVQFLDDGTDSVTEIPFNYNYLKDNKPVVIVSTRIGFMARYAGGGLQIYEIDMQPMEYFISNIHRDHEYFFSFLAEHYPRDLNFILFHPELFRGEFEP